MNVWKLDGDHLVKTDNLDFFNVEADTGWIDLFVPTVEEDHSVESCLRISIPTKEDMQEIEISSRLYEENGAEYMTMIAVAHMDLDDPIKSPVTFILYKNTLVTVRYHELTSFKNYILRVQKPGGVPIASGHGLMTGLMDAVIDRIADSIEDLGRNIDQISRAIFRSRNVTIRHKTDVMQVAIRKVGYEGDLLGMLRESLATIARVLSHQYAVAGEGNKPLKQKMAELNRDVVSLNDHAAFMAGKMNFLLDATLGMINLEQNQIIKIFSIAAVVFLPPTLVASIYGMNFHHMPELDSVFGYPLALTAMVITGVLPILYFKKKGWL